MIIELSDLQILENSRIFESYLTHSEIDQNKVKILVEKGVELNRINPFMENCLNSFIKNNTEVQFLQYLVDKKAKINLFNENGMCFSYLNQINESTAKFIVNNTDVNHTYNGKIFYEYLLINYEDSNNILKYEILKKLPLNYKSFSDKKTC
jgi:hypothetical protein